MFRRLLAPRSVIIMLLTGALVATGGYAWAQTTAQPEKVVACTFNRVLFLADSTTQKCSIGTRVELVTTAYQDPDVADLKSRVAALESEVDALQDKLSKVSYDPTGLNGHPTLKIGGANLQIVSGSGATDATVNGLGNLFIGYAENTLNRPQTGSHNLVLGAEQLFTSYGGLIAGRINALLGPYSSVSGGRNNTASGDFSSVSGGGFSTASGFRSSVSGGLSNTASGNDSSVSGGRSNTASSFRSSVSGGFSNTASGIESSVSGGDSNTASGIESSVSGGLSNTASGEGSSVSGGWQNTASGVRSSVLGGSSVLVNTLNGTSP